LGGVLERTLDFNYEVQGSNPYGGARPRNGIATVAHGSHFSFKK